MFYTISRERMLKEFEKSRKENKGVINWFVDTNLILNVIYDVDNVKYIYKTPYPEAREDIVLKIFIMERGGEILSVVGDDLSEEQEPLTIEMPKVVVNADNY